MTLNMNDDHLVSVAQLKEFARLSNSAKFKSNSSKVETYEWISNALVKFRYVSLKKKEKSIVKKYIMKMTGYSDGAVDRLISRKKKFGKIFVKERTQNIFPKFYEGNDIELLAEVSNVTLNQNGHALKAMCKSMYLDFSDLRFEKLSKISVSHLYNLKKTNIYEHKSLFYTKTNPVRRNIGERRKPQSNGIPGHLRVDSVHQGDLDLEKGVYHINIVDEVTQAEYVGCVKVISEYFLLPVMEELLKTFPFKILGFHSDNGSEYINHQVANMLKKMLVDQTKSRSRRTNDNALVEGKNGAIVRKYLGYSHIPKGHAKKINAFYREYLNPYLNHHRFCGFATDYINEKGKIKKKYETYMTPIQKLLSLPEYEKYLKEGITKVGLLLETKRMTHLDAAKKVFVERQQLFRKINRKI
jgi:hypothetical protein